MERMTELYRPSEKDHAFNLQAGYQDAWQWYYHDGVFTNGYSLVNEWMVQQTQSGAAIWFNVYDPDGNPTVVMPSFHPSAVVASTETLDVKMGDNHLWQDGPYSKFNKYQLRFHHGDMGADLVYECMTQGFREPPDGVFFGRQQLPPTPAYIGLVDRCRCRITGKLIIAGKEIPVEGEGDAHHHWTNVGPMDTPILFWYVGKMHLTNYTFYWWEMGLAESLGYGRAKWLWSLKDDKVFEYLRNPDFYVELADLTVDPESGITYPRKMIFNIDESKIKGTATYTVKFVPFKWKPSPPPKVGWSNYVRFISDCHSKFEIEGKKIEENTKEIHEIMI